MLKKLPNGSDHRYGQNKIVKEYRAELAERRGTDNLDDYCAKVKNCSHASTSCEKKIVYALEVSFWKVSGLKTIDITVDVCKKIMFEFFIIFLRFQFLSLVLANIDTFGV